MILQRASAHYRIVLETSADHSMSGRIGPLRDFAVFVSLSSRTSPRYSQVRWGIIARGLRDARDKRVLQRCIRSLGL